MNAFKKIFFAGACLFVIGCYYDAQDVLYKNVGKSGPCDTTNITYTYAGSVSKIINANCSCHSSTSGSYTILDNFGALQVQAANGRLMGDINQSPGFSAMPPGNMLSPCDIAVIQRWVDLNTPQN